jgi:hypothetical protein
VLLCDCYVECKSARKCQRRFRRKFPDIRAPHRNTIQSLVKKFRTGGVLIEKTISIESIEFLGAC